MFDLGPVLALQVAENSQIPGTGRIVAAVTSVEEHDGTVNNILWTPRPQMFDATFQRFPDLRSRPGWSDYANKLATEDLVVEELTLQVRRHIASGGAVAMWDAPGTLARLAPYGFKTPARIIDLKIFNRIMLEIVRGRRTPETMAETLKVLPDDDLGPGLEREAETILHLAELVRELIKVEELPGVPQHPSDWDELHHLQMLAAAEQAAGIKRWRRVQKLPNGEPKFTEPLKVGWPVWGS